MIKLFEAFAGIGTQRMALRNLGIEHEVVGISEIDNFALFIVINTVISRERERWKKTIVNQKKLNIIKV